VFHDITVGTNAMPCSVQGSAAGTCVGNGGDAYGIIGGAGGGPYAATPGYDLATGLGSLDAGQLVFALGAPGAPTGLLASAHADAVNLSWTPAARATSYNVYAGTAAGQEATTPLATGITGNGTTVAGLAAGQSYYLTVAAVSPFGVSPASNEAEAMTAPSAPVGVQTADEAGSVTVSWQASAGANAYTVYEGPASSTPATAVVSATAATAYSLSGLEPGVAYAFAVAASNSAGASPESAPVTVIAPPATPAGLVATAGNGSVSLSWNSAPGANSYSVFVGAGSGNESASPLQAGIATTSTTVSGLTNGSTYYFSVAAVNAGGTSASSNESAATPTAPSGGGGALDASLLAVLLLAVAARQRTYH
jgi:fibronectin type 3 domain-containing protein